MFEPTSRYANIEIATRTVTGADGKSREVRYLRRRFVPQPDANSTLVEHEVVAGDRLDNLTARYLGEPELFWTVCDTNGAMHPLELTEEIARKIRIALAGAPLA